jgi:hypothetical protein
MRFIKEVFKALVLFVVLYGIISLTSCATSRRKCIEKYCSQDTVRTQIIVHDTVVTEAITKDTVFSTSIDTVTITKDKLTIKYIKHRDSVYLSGKYDADTIIRVDTINVAIPVNCPELSTLQHVRSVKWICLLIFFIGVALGVWLKK